MPSSSSSLASAATTSGAGQGVSVPDKDQVATGEAVLIGAAVIGFLIVLVILRFGFNMFIDVCILEESPSRVWREWQTSCQRWWQQIIVHCCCCCRCCSGGGGGGAHETSPRPEDENDGARNRHTMSAIELEKIHVDGLSRMKHLSRILPESKLTEQDIHQWKDKYHITTTPTTSTELPQSCHQQNTVLCSICLQELFKGDRVFRAQQCHHIFHKPCILRWIVRSLDCPNCRTQLLVSSSNLEQLLLLTAQTTSSSQQHDDEDEDEGGLYHVSQDI